MLAPLLLTFLGACHAVKHWGEFVELVRDGDDKITCQYWNGKDFPNSHKYWVTLTKKGDKSETISLERRQCADGYWTNTDGAFDFMTNSPNTGLDLNLIDSMRQLSITDPVNNQDIFGMAQDCWGRYINVTMPDSFSFDGNAYCSVKNAKGDMNLAVQVDGTEFSLDSIKYRNLVPDPTVPPYNNEDLVLAVGAQVACQLKDGDKEFHPEVVIGQNNDDVCRPAAPPS